MKKLKRVKPVRTEVGKPGDNMSRESYKGSLETLKAFWNEGTFTAKVKMPKTVMMLWFKDK